MTNPYIHLKFRTRIRAAIVGLVMLGLFGIGVFISQVVDARLAGLVKHAQLQLRQKYGVALTVGHTEAGFGSLMLSEVSVGDPAWFVIDKVTVGVSVNPFRDFLRPSVVNMGRAVAKIPWRRDLWPRELEVILKTLRSDSSDALEARSDGKTGLSRFMPRFLDLKAARIEISDAMTTKVFGDNVNFQVRLFEKTLSMSADRVQILDVFNETFLDTNIKSLSDSMLQVSVAGRLNKAETVLWKADCGVNRNTIEFNCRVDASRLPQSMVGYFQRYLGSGFAPSYVGNVSATKMPGSDSAKFFKIGVDGQFGKVYVEHPSLALSAVGPSFIKTHVNAVVDLDRRNVKIMRSSIGLFGADPFSQKVTIDPLPLDVQGDVSFSKKGDAKFPLSGFVNVDIPSIPCQSGFQAIPKSFVPELEGIKLSGSAELHLKANFSEAGSQFSMKDSRFDCSTAVVPEIFSAAYLNGPFNIERNLPDGKIYIPVDPARPYFTAYRDIPKIVRDAFVSSEDAGFYAHKGVEISAILGAVERNAEEGRAAVGGSTITMQTVKNLFLARDKTISRKVQEVFLAWHLERIISKERILEIYLNMVEFGPSLYGIGLASQRFFGKHPRDLSLKESIYLASLLPAPVPRYRYFCKGETTANYDRIIKQLLDRMLGLGRVTFEQHGDALAEKLKFSPVERESACGLSKIAEMEQAEAGDEN